MSGITQLFAARRLLCKGLLLVFATIANAQSQTAQEAHQAMLKNLVQLEAKGVGTTGPSTGAPVGGAGTGFLVSSDGYVLTSYHILEKIQEAQGTNLEIKATLLDGTAMQTVGAKVVNAAPMLDLLLLKVPESLVQPYSFARLGESRSLTNGDAILASGYHNGQRFTRTGTLSSRDLHYWNVEMPIVGGYSGSPVYRTSGEVVGLIKGNLNTDPNMGVMVPIDLADPLIGGIRNAELRAKLELLIQQIGNLKDGKPVGERLDSVEDGMKDVSKYMSWSASATSTADIVVRYEKLVSGGPRVASVDYTIKPYVRTADGQVLIGSPMKRDTLAASPNFIGPTSGEFRFDKLTDKMKSLLDSNADARGITGFGVSVIPTLDNSEATVLDPEQFRVDLDEEFTIARP